MKPSSIAEPRSFEQWLPDIVFGFENLASHNLRSLLTMLRMIVGVTAVVAMLSIGAGAEQKVMDLIELLAQKKCTEQLFSTVMVATASISLLVGGMGPKHHFLTQFLPELNLCQKHFHPVLGTVYVARPQLRSRHSGVDFSHGLICRQEQV